MPATFIVRKVIEVLTKKYIPGNVRLWPLTTSPFSNDIFSWIKVNEKVLQMFNGCIFFPHSDCILCDEVKQCSCNNFDADGHFEHPNLLSFDFNGDTDPDFHSNADPDPSSQITRTSPSSQDPDFNMDCDATEQMQQEIIESTRGRKKSKRR
jgi:hypothetical protein